MKFLGYWFQGFVICYCILFLVGFVVFITLSVIGVEFLPLTLANYQAVLALSFAICGLFGLDSAIMRITEKKDDEDG